MRRGSEPRALPARKENSTLPYLELILLVFGASVKGSVVAEFPDVVHPVEALDVVRDALSLQHLLALRDGGHGVDLQVWEGGVKEETRRAGPHASWAAAELGVAEGRGWATAWYLFHSGSK